MGGEIVRAAGRAGAGAIRARSAAPRGSFAAPAGADSLSRMRDRSRRRYAPLAAVAVGAGLAATPPALAVDAPRLSASVPGLTAADVATFSWTEVAADPGRLVGYQGGMGDELTTFGAQRSTTRPLREGGQTFRIRAVELRRGADGRGEVEASPWEYLSIVSDQSAPGIRGTGAPAGWASAPVTIRFTCTDAISGIASCTGPVRVDAEGADQSVTGVATDRVGRRSTARVDGISIDRTAPSTPRLADVGRTSSVRPTLSWSARDGLSGIDGYRISLDGRQVGAVGGGVTSYTPGADLAPGRHTWSVTATDRAGNEARSQLAAFEIDVSVPATPLLQGPSGLIADRAPVFSWSGPPGARYSWELEGPGGSRGRGVLTTATSFQARDLEDGAYTFRVTQTNELGATGGAATLGFTLDGTPPPAPVVTDSPAAPLSPGARPLFRWRAGEPQGGFVWQILGAGGVPVQGPQLTELTEARAAPLAPGDYLFQVRQLDAAGNAGALSAGAPFVVAAAAVASAGVRDGASETAGAASSPRAPRTVAAGGRAAARALARNARMLRPAPGRVAAGLRPRLSWRGTPRGTTLQNVQVFAVRGRALVKIHTAFPAGRSYRLPRGVLRPGQVYVWRVWPYLGRRGFARRPLGISWFRTRGAR